MSKYTIKQLIAYSNIDATLIRSTIRQAGGWAEFQEIANDVCKHGADCGFSGFIYYSETIPFAKRNKKAAMALLDAYAKDLGGASTFKLIASFNCLRRSNLTDVDVSLVLLSGKGDGKDIVFNALAWFALEEVSRAYVQMTEE